MANQPESLSFQFCSVSTGNLFLIVLEAGKYKVKAQMRCLVRMLSTRKMCLVALSSRDGRGRKGPTGSGKPFDKGTDPWETQQWRVGASLQEALINISDVRAHCQIRLALEQWFKCCLGHLHLNRSARVKSWLLCFRTSFLLIHLGTKTMMAQVLCSSAHVGDWTDSSHLAFAQSSSGYCRHFESEPGNGQFCLSLFQVEENKHFLKKENEKAK